MKANYIFENTDGAALKMWTKGVPVCDNAKAQLYDLAKMPFIFKHIAVMPDVHAGKGSTIGSVIASLGAVAPSLAGVDIGCGMFAVRTNLTKDQLPKDLAAVRKAIEAVIPHGRTDNGGQNDKGAFKTLPDSHQLRWDALKDEYTEIITKHPKAYSNRSEAQLGTLGTGNHYAECCIDKEDRVWLMLHSGSRGAGNKLGTYFMKKAEEEMERYFLTPHLPNKDLSYLVEGTELFDDYIKAANWAQKYAYENRCAMMDAMVGAVRAFVPGLELTDTQVNCHHNYVSKESHFGKNVWVVRKGAVRARDGELGIIPGSMGSRSFIVKGKGSKDSFHSCSHGAGRVMSRTAASKCFTLEEHKAAMVGIEARLDEGVLEETPKAYKDINAVMAAQADLVEPIFELRQVINIKG